MVGVYVASNDRSSFSQTPYNLLSCPPAGGVLGQIRHRFHEEKGCDYTAKHLVEHHRLINIEALQERFIKDERRPHEHIIPSGVKRLKLESERGD